MNSKTLWRSSILVVSRERRWHGQLELVRTFPSKRRDRGVPQSWNTSFLCKSVKIFEPWFHVIETWVFYTIGSISNPKLLAHIIRHLILQGSFSFMQVVQRKQFYHLILWQPEKYLLRFTPALYNLATCNFADELCTNCQGVVEVLSRMLSNERRSGPPLSLALPQGARARVCVRRNVFIPPSLAVFNGGQNMEKLWFFYLLKWIAVNLPFTAADERAGQRAKSHYHSHTSSSALSLSLGTKFVVTSLRCQNPEPKSVHHFVSYP